jgi:Nif-specific regulatory protein
MMDDVSPASLVAIAGPATGETFRIDQQEGIIGRDEENGLAVPDPSISRRHCTLRWTAAGWWVYDLDSFNGTFLNGERVQEAALHDGDRLRAGETEFLFRYHSPRAESPLSGSLRATTRLHLQASRYLQPGSLDQPDVRTQRDLQALVRLGTVVNGLRERRHVETEILRTAFDVVPARRAVLLRGEWGARDLQTVAVLPAEDPTPFPRDQALVDLAVARKEGVLSVAAVAANRTPPSAGDGQPASVLAVPLCDESEVAGLLYLTARDGIDFDQLHLELVVAVAGIGSVALQNVRRLEAFEAETERLKRALRITHHMTGESSAIQHVHMIIAKVAPTAATVLISGETGTGKELAARAVHASSPRSHRPFVAINCAALPENLLESELFGHERGAFTGAIATKRGQFELANGGTLFLDEIGELPPALQAKLLRVLQQREIQRVGGAKPIQVDIRLIAASNRRLADEVRSGRFREDLLYRLKVVELEMPPLRKRPRDIPILASHFLARAGERYGRQSLILSPAAERCLAAYEWPGNVRELENVIDSAVIMSSSPEIGVDDLPDGIVERAAAQGHMQSSSFHGAVLETKKRVILRALAEAGGRITEAARLLDLHPNYLHRLLNGLGLRPGADAAPLSTSPADDPEGR